MDIYTNSLHKSSLTWRLKSMWRHSRYRRIVWTVLIFAFWCAVVPPVYVTYLKEGSRADSALDVQGSNSPDYIHVTMIVQQADLTSHKLNIYVTATPYGAWANGRAELASNVTGYFAYKSFDFAEKHIMQSFDLSVPLLGYPRMYPFDEYESFLEVGFVEQSEDRKPIPLRVTIYGSVQSLSFDIHAELSADVPETLDFKITTGRTQTTLFFSVFIMMVMWALSITLMVLAFQVTMERRTIPAPLTAVGATILFALPALRNSQPGIPAVGCASDALSYFWNLLVIAVSSMSIIMTWILRWKYRPGTAESTRSNSVVLTMPTTSHKSAMYSSRHSDLDDIEDSSLTLNHPR
ncbi:hypothetical protein IWQ61_009912 [Dispira simplex]|nr:hypothetical protein IWQ61_009912 [Dispira simplex]